jgi:hypothetical protein
MCSSSSDLSLFTLHLGSVGDTHTFAVLTRRTSGPCIEYALLSRTAPQARREVPGDRVVSNVQRRGRVNCTSFLCCRGGFSSRRRPKIALRSLLVAVPNLVVKSFFTQIVLPRSHSGRVALAVTRLRKCRGVDEHGERAELTASGVSSFADGKGYSKS